VAGGLTNYSDKNEIKIVAVLPTLWTAIHLFKNVNS
jgi:hypothetical protein